MSQAGDLSRNTDYTNHLCRPPSDWHLCTCFNREHFFVLKITSKPASNCRKWSKKMNGHLTTVYFKIQAMKPPALCCLAANWPHCTWLNGFFFRKKNTPRPASNCVELSKKMNGFKRMFSSEIKILLVFKRADSLLSRLHYWLSSLSLARLFWANWDRT